mgnify:FL=1
MKKLFCILISFVLVAGAITSFAGCGPKTPEDNRAVRALDTSFVNVWQGSDGTVYVELKDFEHDDYQFISDSGQGATSIEFSLDGGSSWARQDPVEYFFNQTDRGIYSILSHDGNEFTCYLTGYEGENMPQNPKFNAGADLSITFRIPESDTYKASEWSTATTYTLKAPGTDNSEIFANFFGSFLNDKEQYESETFLSANYFESNGFVVYRDENLLKFGKIESKASSNEPRMYDYTFTPLEELAEEDKTEVAKFEYKFVSKLEYEQNATAESTDLLTSITPDIQTYEDNLLMSGTWTAVTVDGFEFNATNSNYIWQYNVEIPNVSTGETETYTYTSFILLVRIKATDSTAHSGVHVLEYQLSYKPAE